MTFWILIGVMTILALAFVLLPVLKPGVGRKPILIAAAVIGVPLLAVLAYQKVGTPPASNAPAAMPSMPPMGAMPPMGQMPPATMPPGATMPPNHPSSNAMNMDLGQLADRLAEKLKNQPENADGWALLARTYVEVKRYKEAIPTFEKASALLPKDPNLQADYADALAKMNGGKFDKKAEGLVEQALKQDPNNPKALMLKATIAYNHKDYAMAIEHWEKLLKVPGLDAERTKEATGSIAEAKHQMSMGKK